MSVEWLLVGVATPRQARLIVNELMMQRVCVSLAVFLVASGFVLVVVAKTAPSIPFKHLNRTTACIYHCIIYLLILIWLRLLTWRFLVSWYHGHGAFTGSLSSTRTVRQIEQYRSWVKMPYLLTCSNVKSESVPWTHTLRIVTCTPHVRRSHQILSKEARWVTKMKLRWMTSSLGWQDVEEAFVSKTDTYDKNPKSSTTVWLVCWHMTVRRTNDPIFVILSSQEGNF